MEEGNYILSNLIKLLIILNEYSVFFFLNIQAFWGETSERGKKLYINIPMRYSFENVANLLLHYIFVHYMLPPKYINMPIRYNCIESTHLWPFYTHTA